MICRTTKKVNRVLDCAKEKLYDRLVIFSIIVLSLILFVFVYSQYRYFYKVDDVTFTVWKKWGGYCYITPYRYWGLSAPENDYIKARNVGKVHIFINNRDSSLLIFNYSSHDVYSNDIECVFSNFKFQHFKVKSNTGEDIMDWEIKSGEYRDSLSCIDIDIMHMKVWIKEIRR